MVGAARRGVVLVCLVAVISPACGWVGVQQRASESTAPLDPCKLVHAAELKRHLNIAPDAPARLGPSRGDPVPGAVPGAAYCSLGHANKSAWVGVTRDLAEEVFSKSVRGRSEATKVDDLGSEAVWWRSGPFGHLLVLDRGAVVAVAVNTPDDDQPNRFARARGIARIALTRLSRVSRG